MMETGLHQQSGTYQSTLLCTLGFLIDEIVISGSFRHHPRTGNLRSRWGSWSKNVIRVRKSNLQSIQIHLKRSAGHRKHYPCGKLVRTTLLITQWPKLTIRNFHCCLSSSSCERLTKSYDPNRYFRKPTEWVGDRDFSENGIGTQRTSGAKLIETFQ